MGKTESRGPWNVHNARWPSFDQAMLAVATVIPVLVALLHAENITDTAHDGGVVRTVALGWDGPWHTLDAWTAAPFLILPIGTETFRAALASAAVCGAAGAVIYQVTRALLASCAAAPRLGPSIAAIASLMASLSMAWQIEALAPGGATLGALLVWLSVAMIAPPRQDKEQVGQDKQQGKEQNKQQDKEQVGQVGLLRVAGSALPCALAVAYEPWVGIAAASAVVVGNGVLYLQSRAHRGAPPRMKAAFLSRIVPALLAAAVVPLLLALLRRSRGPLASVASGGDRYLVSNILHFTQDQLGWLALALAGAGLVLALLVRRARPLAAALAAVVAAGALALGTGVASGPAGYAAVTLAALAAVASFAGVAMQAIARAAATARVPFASATAAMIVLLEVVFPIVILDGTSMRVQERMRAARVPWHEAMFGPLPARTVLLAHDERFIRHLIALRAGSLLRSDLAIVSTANLGARPAMRELSREPALAPFFRDMALAGAPTEWGLTQLAAERPLAVLFQPEWDRAIARHLLADGAIDLFYPEPRSTLERKRALEAFVPVRQKWERILASPDNPDLRALTAVPLAARVAALTSAQDREPSLRAADDLHGFSR